MGKNVTFSRKISPLNILKDGVILGRIYPTATKTRHYAIDLHGKYWKTGADEPNTRGGSPGKWFKTLKEAKDAAIKFA